MKPAPFQYSAPNSITATVKALHQYGDEAKLLAGGQSLVPVMNFRLVQPAVIIDLNGVAELQGISQLSDGSIRIEAMTRQREVEHSPLIAEYCPLIAEMMPHIAHPQIRNRGTIGGSMAHADPAAELPVAAVALDAVFEIRNNAGIRRTPAKSFYKGLFDTDLSETDLLTAIEIPPWDSNLGYAFIEVARRHGDFALAGVAAVVELDGEGKCRHSRLVYLNLGEIPMDASQAVQSLIGEKINDEAIANAADIAAAQEIDPSGNIHASVEYQSHLARVLTERALRKAVERVTNNQL